MTLCLCNISTVEYLRSARVLPRAVMRSLSVERFAPCASDVELLARGGFACLSMPVHLLVPRASDRRRLKRATCHACSEALVPGSILRIARDVCSASPELCFLHLASSLTLPRLVRLGFELCGSYRLSASNPAGFVKGDPLTSVAELGRFLEAAGSARGAVLAKRALGYVLDGSASPMETILVMLLCLPPRWGGYGLPAPRMNARVDVTKRARMASARGYYVCDLLWPAQNVAVEYDSDAYHTGAERIASDASRRNALSYLGIAVVTVTRAQVLDCGGMDKTARAIAKLLGKRLRFDDRTWKPARLALRRELLSFSHEVV